MNKKKTTAKDLSLKFEILKNILEDENPIIAFSGGADSTLLAILAKKYSKDPLAVTIDNGLMDYDFSDSCSKIAKDIGINHLIIKDNYLDNNKFTKNDSNRCYICRDMMYSKIEEIKNKDNYTVFLDGNNISDLFGNRPGIIVNYERNVISPFILAGLESEDIINYLEENKIDYLKSSTCLATRVKSKQKLTKSNIANIEKIERVFREITSDEKLRIKSSNFYKDTFSKESSDNDKYLDNNILYLYLTSIKPLLNSETIKKLYKSSKKLGYDVFSIKLKRNEPLIDIDEIIIDEYLKKENLNKDIKTCLKEFSKEKNVLKAELPYKIDIKKSLKLIEIYKNSMKVKRYEKAIILSYNGKRILIDEEGRFIFVNVLKEELLPILKLILPLIKRLLN